MKFKKIVKNILNYVLTMSEKTLFLFKKPGVRLQLVKMLDVSFPYQIRKNRKILYTEFDLVAALYHFRSEVYQILSQTELLF